MYDYGPKLSSDLRFLDGRRQAYGAIAIQWQIRVRGEFLSQVRHSDRSCLLVLSV